MHRPSPTSLLLASAGLALAAAPVLPAPAASAHLEPGSLSSPQAGAAYAPGGTVIARWVQSQYHAGTYRFEFSPDGGVTWSETGSRRASGADGDTVAFAWSVPATATERARFRVCQPGAPCTDPDYRLESGDFAIRAGASLRGARAAPGAALAWDAGRGNVEVTLTLDAAAPVRLRAYDARGARAADLYEADLGPGTHAFRAPLPAPGAGTPLLLRLEAGGRPRAEARVVSR